jgi:hypothetical protein
VKHCRFFHFCPLFLLETMRLLRRLLQLFLIISQSDCVIFPVDFALVLPLPEAQLVSKQVLHGCFVSSESSSQNEY